MFYYYPKKKDINTEENMDILIDILTCNKLKLKKYSFETVYRKFYNMFLYHNKYFITNWFLNLFAKLKSNMKPLTNISISCDVILYGLNNNYYDRLDYINVCHQINFKIVNTYKIITQILLFKLDKDIIENYIIKFLIIS